jgi:hypothetical protein
VIGNSMRLAAVGALLAAGASISGGAIQLTPSQAQQIEAKVAADNAASRDRAPADTERAKQERVKGIRRTGGGRAGFVAPTKAPSRSRSWRRAKASGLASSRKKHLSQRRRGARKGKG